jgi:hypothetical protein
MPNKLLVSVTLALSFALVSFSLVNARPISAQGSYGDCKAQARAHFGVAPYQGWKVPGFYRWVENCMANNDAPPTTKESGAQRTNKSGQTAPAHPSLDSNASADIPSGLPQQIPAQLNCNPSKKESNDQPDFTAELTFKYSMGALSAERTISRRAGKDNYVGSVEPDGAIKITSTGKYDDDRSSWTSEFSGRFNKNSNTVLKGRYRNLNDNSVRDCTIVFLLGSEPRPKLSLTGQLQETQFVLRNIVMPVTESGRYKDWMLRVSSVPVQQQQFCRIVDRFYNQLDEADKTRNEIKRNTVFRERQNDMASLLPGGRFENWVVVVSEVVQAADGSAAIMLQPPCRAMLGSDACRNNGAKISATITPGSTSYRELERLSAGDFVVISGRIPYAEPVGPNQPLPSYGMYEAGTHCSKVEGDKIQDVFVTDISYLVQLR